MTTGMDFVSQLSIAFSNSSLYSADHLMTERSIGRALEALAGHPSDRVELMIVEGSLVLDRSAMKDPGLHGRGVVRRLLRKGISRVDFLRGVTFGEMKQFVSEVTDPERPITPSPGIRTGVIDVREAGREEVNPVEPGNEEEFAEGRIDQFREIYSGISPFRRLQVVGLEEVVAGFVDAIRQEANILQMISPVMSHSEYTYTHAANVSLLTICQAESLGFKGEVLHDIGMAGLMHDVGKLFISREVLHKKGSLDEKEFDEMKRHPAYGASYLARIGGLSRLVPLAAWEHHRKIDGGGYPEMLPVSLPPHECSQIITIADFFDALRSNRPYREGWSVGKIIGIMREEAGRSFNTSLLANFETVLTKALGGEIITAGPPR